MSNRSFFFSFLFSLVFLSCKFYPPKSPLKDDILPHYQQNIVWTLDTNSFGMSDKRSCYDKYYYIVENDYSDEQNKYFFSKINLENGERLWSTDSVFSTTSICYPILFEKNGKKYVLIKKSGLIYYFDDESGELKGSIKYNKNDYEQDISTIRNFYWLLIDSSLYWANDPDDKSINPGIVKISLDDVDFENDSEEPLYAEPKVVWQNSYNNQSIFMHPVEKDGVIYFITNNEFEKFDFSIIGAYDTKFDKTLWEQKTTKLTGLGCENMYVVDDKLYIIEDGQGCYRLKDGKIIWEQKLTLEEMKTQVDLCGSIYSRGITYWNNKFYFTNIAGYLTTDMSGIPNEYIKNIECMTSDGKYVWGDMPDGSGSLYTQPIVLDGKCFVVCWNNLRVYDAETGDVIGIDNSVKSRGFEKPVTYDGMFIYFNMNMDTGTSELVAIRP